jgi:hypothetical protein
VGRDGRSRSPRESERGGMTNAKPTWSGQTSHFEVEVEVSEDDDVFVRTEWYNFLCVYVNANPAPRSLSPWTLRVG